jgi:hypothetical protein
MAYACLAGEGFKETEEILKKGVKRVAYFLKDA